MTREISWTIDGITADGYLGPTPTKIRGSTISLEFRFANAGGNSNYDALRQYLDYANGQTIRTGLTDRGVPWVRERLTDRAPVDSLIVPIEAGADVLDVDGLWGAIVGGEDETQPPAARKVTIDVVVLAELGEYADRAQLLNDLGSDVI